MGTASVFEKARALVESRGVAALSRDAREALAHHAADLVERNRIADGLWVMGELLADPDPRADAQPTSGTISTVRGAVAWLAYRLGARTSTVDLGKVVNAAAALVADGNRYVRETAAPLLGALMGRRDELTAEGRFALDVEARANIKAMWRGYVHAAVDDHLEDEAARTTASALDLEEGDVLDVVDTLLPGVSDEGLGHLMSLLVQFGYLRQLDRNLPVAVGGDRVRARLAELLASRADCHDRTGFFVFRLMRDQPALRSAVTPVLLLLMRHAPNAWSLHFCLACVVMVAQSRLLSAEIGDLLVQAAMRVLRATPDDERALRHLVRTFRREMVGAGAEVEADELLGRAGLIDAGGASAA